MKIAWKIFMIFSITGLGAGITCGGNLLLVDKISLFWNDDNWFIIWWIEILIIFVLSIWLIFFKKIPKNLIKEIKISISSETEDLMNSLSQVDISHITSITFLPKNRTWFTIKTPNIKRLAIHITTKLEKTIFETEELRKPFDYVVKNISSNLSKWDFDLVTGKIEEFVKSWGEVKINRV